MEPIVRTITVPAPCAQAFERFTAKMGSWWPLVDHSVAGENAESVTFEERAGGRIYEVARDGAEADWGAVVIWDPPHKVAFSWHPGREPSTAQQVEVTFEDSGGHTRVTLSHSGWENFGDGAEAAHAEYGPGWDYVFGACYGGPA